MLAASFDCTYVRKLVGKVRNQLSADLICGDYFGEVLHKRVRRVSAAERERAARYFRLIGPPNRFGRS
jgi:hypothetical protein